MSDIWVYVLVLVGYSMLIWTICFVIEYKNKKYQKDKSIIDLYENQDCAIIQEPG